MKGHSACLSLLVNPKIYGHILIFYPYSISHLTLF
jgi:hypothetical protein